MEAPAPAAFQAWLQTLDGYEEAEVLALHPVAGGASNVILRGPPRGCAAARRPPPPAARARHLRAVRRRPRGGRPAPPRPLRRARAGRRRRGARCECAGGALRRPGVGRCAPHGVAGPQASFTAYAAMVARIHASTGEGSGSMTCSPFPLRRGGHPRRARRGGRAHGALPRRRCPHPRPRLPRPPRERPRGRPLGLCQGDINVFNYLVRAGQVVAVVDWEQARIGDVRNDIGQLLALSHLKGAPLGPRATPSSSRPTSGRGAPVS